MSARLYVREWRVERGWLQGELADKIGCRAATLSDIELGKVEPHAMTLAAIAKALGVEPERLRARPNDGGRQWQKRRKTSAR